MPRERMTAVRASIADIVDGTYGVDNGPRVITKDNVELRRVTLVGSVADHPVHGDAFSSLILTDGTQKIRVKAWKTDKDKIKDIEKGSLLMIIGKIRAYNDEVYIVPEIVREFSSQHYMELHLLQRYHSVLKSSEGETEKKVPSAEPRQAKDEQTALQDSDFSAPTEIPLADMIHEFIQVNARASGVSIQDLVAYFKARGYSTTDVHLEIINLQQKQMIEEVQIGVYTPTVDSHNETQTPGVV
ncbi:MAG: OB-fold nucleic acid binding domain-containing protein [Candidatus Thorarchaeota archaeon]